MGSTTDEEFKEKLLWNVKREVKQIMEEAVTKKFVHEDSSHIIALCSSIEACLSHLLKRRAAGFLRSDKIAALFTKIGKVNTTVSEICRKVQEQLQQQAEITRRTQSTGQESLRRQGSSTGRAPQPLSAQAIKHIWVRTALFEKVLDKIVQYIVDNASKYYEREALMHDSVFGPILAALLVGPCALEYTKLKTSDHFWTDPSANELVQRHRIHGAHRGQEVSPGRRPALGIRKRQSSGSMSEDKFAASAREYVESLHQNSRVHLLYGKNNVLVQPKKDMEVLRGYLSLHQTAETLTLKWTPNQLINGTLGDCDLEKSIYWDYALTVPLRQIVCIHCHQRPDCGGTLVLVSQDGIQRPPLHFPPGGHLLAFLSCLETGLLPRGQLEPPLWSQRGKGKVFPKLRKRNSTARLVDQDGDGEDQIAADYVFRIVYPGHRHDSITINYHHSTGSRAPSLDDDEEEEDRLHAMISMICSRNLTDPNVMKDHGDLMEMQGFGGSPLSWQQGECTSHMSSCLSCSTGGSNASVELPASCTCMHDRIPLKMLCQNMKRQIVSRAFYGWLAYCRHLSTVRTHLSALVNHNIVPPDKPCEASGGLSKDVWSKYQKDCKNYKELELLRLVYYGGVEHEIRKEVWPFLLGHYKFGMDKKNMAQIDEKITARYQQVMREWKACEVIVKQREKEMQSAIFAKLSSGSSIDSHVLRLIHRDSTISNEVFMSVDEPDAGGQDTSCEDSTPTLTTVVTPAMLAPDERPLVEFDSPDSGLPSSRNYSVASGHSQIMSSIDDGQSMEEDTTPTGGLEEQGGRGSLSEDKLCSQLDKLTTTSSSEGTAPSFSSYTIELLDTVALNLHRIDKDVQRCDRNYYYFTSSNLEKLRNIMCSYVWEHLEIGYVQGMCDLLAPLMVILDDECLAYSCFTQLMRRMSQNFPTGGAMDTHFANMRSLIQILDSELFELMHQNGDYTHFYFCYRWFLLDFKRELLYEDVFAVWEVIWVAPRISSKHFVLFIALALVEVYRDIILDNNMDFTDIIKFFNEMAERHDVQHILRMARELVHKVQTLIENK
ncbi:small G protein signaling modulator 2 isoform X2 [Danio rerio]|uniref:Small G protein signaling modulator 2 isoform X2 n=1 Tax=Danio rerio TaxID=7955 RepID=A0A8M9PNK7_DANRE|nr:small G protein signaling modulator 2 isoform X1 [Danio rerio]XP_021322073.1 small G protein signaling modulator 2 isoform X1 [Danio rerio]XP_021328613.1 small G protein signaling modulator 2 isoform X1 [Danio rerio]|eukprot:XP_003200084.2 small G protein signaling modulator 2 isoform X1 [Danio rerio]